MSKTKTTTLGCLALVAVGLCLVLAGIAVDADRQSARTHAPSECAERGPQGEVTLRVSGIDLIIPAEICLKWKVG